MVDWLQLAVIAFGAQLAVLPGEKVQLIVAGLSTRYDPKVVIAAAASAFAGWTAVELAVGAALQELLAPQTLDAITAGLFLLFAVMLYRSAPAPDADGPVATTDGGTADASQHGPETLDPDLFGLEVPDRFGSFLPIFVLMATGEVGDKTQLVTIGLAVQYGAHPAIWAGEMAAIVPVTIANAYLFHHFAHRFDRRKAHLAGAALFLLFGLDTVLALLTGFSVWEWAVGHAAELVTAMV